MAKNKFKYVLLFLLLLIFITSIVAMYFNTDMFVKHPGSIIEKTLVVNDLIDGEVGGGYLIINRDSRTPVAAESVTFDNDDSYLFFSISDGEQLKEKMTINIPVNMVSGIYYYQVSAIINNKVFVKNFKYIVG